MKAKIEKEFDPMDDLVSLINPAHVGLLVVDVQTKLWPSIEERETILKPMCQAIEVAGHLGLDILVTEQYVKGLGPTLPEVESALAGFKAYNPIEKVAFSCFGEPAFERAVELADVETLVIIGIEAHVCVMQTALDALDRDMDVFLIAEATGSRNRKHKKEAIRRVRDAGAIVGSVEMFAFEVMRTAKHPAFRAVQKSIL
jgi:isochorismate hydrolase